MQTILAGHVDTQQRAQDVMARLRERGIALGDMQAFYVTPPGQHGDFPIGGDEYADRDAKHAHKDQLKGAAIGSAAGLAAGGIAAAVVPPLAPVIIAGVTGVGALAGSVAGAAAGGQTQEESEQSDDPHPQLHEGGLMIAVRSTPQTEAAILETLRASGVREIERASGEWRDGHWVDFDPKKPAEKIDE